MRLHFPSGRGFAVVIFGPKPAARCRGSFPELFVVFRPSVVGIPKKSFPVHFYFRTPSAPEIQTCPTPRGDTSMREIARPLVRALSLACLAATIAVLSSGEVLAQAKQAPPKQMAPAQAAPPPPQQEAPLKQIALTEAQVQGVLSAAKEMDPIVEKIPENAKPDPKITAQLEAVAKKSGFSSYDE